jgi:hypothetical protein
MCAIWERAKVKKKNATVAVGIDKAIIINQITMV